jgi:hypothetical protein
MRVFATIALLAGLGLLAAMPAQATPRCGDAVVGDWADGRIDGRYPPRCYGDALDSLPEDVRAYSTATDDIAQALRARIRQLRSDTPAQAGADAGPPSVRLASLPLPLVAGAAIALALALAGLARLVGPRLRRARLAHRPTRAVGQW